ncbi:alkaline phosphatase family protein [Heliophilum fasciatum]|uniref:Type I phosphodiesterase/nucleotide pyrophosphatase n=1 Tax=Heliophilum fasciatum TaxID=35700 RepID=A0A4R2RXA4_9FIRM|nr:alkaline phosphatase family protein [Heliophilum fasciatum]MCW2277222.1 hypothetical protein [Heliophilum fasciatum]TCP68143.1 type I phosphodiesterase/nucleotide pyrophosphatase [Heliophilum fasciatum]
MRRKKVIMFIIDSFHPQVLDDVTADGSAPALSFLRKQGFSHSGVVSAFPTMTPTALSSIATGTYADKHKVPGFIWLSEISHWLVNYGATPGSILKLGVFQSVKNLLYGLNQEHVSPLVKTVHEALEERGYSSGNINFFIYRGRKRREAKVPWLVRLAAWLRLQGGPILGPESLALGEFCLSPSLKNFRGPVGLFNKFGFNDRFSCLAARELIKRGKQPDFMMVYLPDNDRFSHRVGPMNTHPCIREADKLIQYVLDAFPSWEHALEHNAILVAGDHSQCQIVKKHNLIRLDRALQKFTQVSMLSGRVRSRDDVAICPNERMAIIYVLKNPGEILPRIVDAFIGEDRISQIMWKEHDHYRVIEGGTGRSLTFWRGDIPTDGTSEHRTDEFALRPVVVVDQYGQRWGYEGDLAVIDGRLDGEVLRFGEYPDALARIASALDCQRTPRVLLSARPGYEFYGEEAPIFPGGGSHGSLHQSDSLVPALIAGSDYDLASPRIIEFYNWLMKQLPERRW